MTDKEAELLRVVAEAAAVWESAYARFSCRVFEGDGADMDEIRMALSDAVCALSAYRAQPQEAEGEMVTMGLIRSRRSGMLCGTVTPEDEDPRDWQHIGNIVFQMPPAIVLPTIPAKVVT